MGEATGRSGEAAEDCAGAGEGICYGDGEAGSWRAERGARLTMRDEWPRRAGLLGRFGQWRVATWR